MGHGVYKPSHIADIRSTCPFAYMSMMPNEPWLSGQRYQYAVVTKDEAQRRPSALLRTVSPSTLLRTVSLSNGLSNGSWTFYEAIIIVLRKRWVKQ